MRPACSRSSSKEDEKDDSIRQAESASTYHGQFSMLTHSLSLCLEIELSRLCKARDTLECIATSTA